MNNSFHRHSLITILTLLIAISIMFLGTAVAQVNNQTSKSNTGWKHLKYAVFFTSYDVQRLLADPADFKKTMDYFSPVKPTSVYIDGVGRDGKVDVPLMKKIAARFRAMGIEADGAMVPTSIHGGTSVYNNPEDLAQLKQRMHGLAQVFDKIILDDWLFTTATDPQSVKDRGNMSWAEYRTKLLLEQSKKYIIDPAKEVNPNVQVIIKFPNWFESFPDNGYDVTNEVKQFDKMAIGIETRITKTQHQHIPIYSGYVLQKWESSADPSKWVGSWLDNYGMKGASNDYNAQVWQAILARTPQIILWCAGQLWPTNPSSNVYPDFVNKLPEFDRVAGLLKGESRGVPMYMPFGSKGEYNLFGYLGMASIPIDPVTIFPKESQDAIFCINSLKDKNLSDELLSRLNDGKDIFITFGLWKKLAEQGTEFKHVLNLLPYSGQVSSSTFGLLQGYSEETVDADQSFTFPGIEAGTWPETRDVTLKREDYDFSVLMKVPYLNGNIYILNLPSNSYDILELPTKVLDAIRQPFYKDLGVQLDGPGKVGMYLFGNKQYVLYNISDKRAPVSLRFAQKLQTKGWKELVKGEQLKVTQDTKYVKYGGPTITDVSLELQPFEIVIVQAP